MHAKFWQRSYEAVQRMGGGTLKSCLLEDCGFLNGLVTVRTEIFDWLRSETRQSSAT